MLLQGCSSRQGVHRECGGPSVGAANFCGFDRSNGKSQMISLVSMCIGETQFKYPERAHLLCKYGIARMFKINSDFHGFVIRNAAH